MEAKLQMERRGELSPTLANTKLAKLADAELQDVFRKSKERQNEVEAASEAELKKRHFVQ